MMKVKFYEISDPKTIYEGELTKTIQGKDLTAVVVRDLRIPITVDKLNLFSSLQYGQVVTLVLNGDTIDFYKSSSTAADHLITTHP